MGFSKRGQGGRPARHRDTDFQPREHQNIDRISWWGRRSVSVLRVNRRVTSIFIVLFFLWTCGLHNKKQNNVTKLSTRFIQSWKSWEKSWDFKMESILVIFFNEFERMHERRSKYKQAYALYMWKMSWVDKDPGQAKCRLCVLCGGKTFNLSNVCVCAHVSVLCPLGRNVCFGVLHCRFKYVHFSLIDFTKCLVMEIHWWKCMNYASPNITILSFSSSF